MYQHVTELSSKLAAAEIATKAFKCVDTSDTIPLHTYYRN